MSEDQTLNTPEAVNTSEQEQTGASQDQSQSTNWEQAYKSTQSQFDSFKNQVLPKVKEFEEYKPYLDDVKALKSLFGPKEPANQNNFWAKPLDQRWQETESKLERLERENNELRSFQTEAKFTRDMDYIVSQYGKDYGDSITFANTFASALNKYYPGWENIYAQNPNRDTIEQLFFNVAGRLNHDPNSPLRAMREEAEKKALLAKQAQTLNGSPDLKFGIQKDASEAYITPLETI